MTLFPQNVPTPYTLVKSPNQTTCTLPLLRTLPNGFPLAMALQANTAALILKVASETCFPCQIHSFSFLLSAENAVINAISINAAITINVMLIKNDL